MEQIVPKFQKGEVVRQSSRPTPPKQLASRSRTSTATSLALKAMPEPERKELIQKAKAGEKVTARKQQEAPLRASEAVSTVIRQMDIFLMVLANSGIPVGQLADRFASEFDHSDAATKAKVEAIIPLLDALGRIGAELDLEEAA